MYLLSKFALLEVATAAALGHRHSGQVGHIQSTQHIHSFLIDFNGIDVNSRLVGDEVHATFTFLFLELERDAADGAALDALHQMLHGVGVERNVR